MPEPPETALNEKGRVEDYAANHQQILDETEQRGKKSKKKKDDPDKIYGWRHYYVAPKLKDFEPGSSLAHRMDTAPPPPPRRVKNATPGRLMLTLLREAHARGALSEIHATFNAQKDSNGRKWSTKQVDLINHKFEPGITMLQVARWLEQHGFAEVRMIGRRLCLYQPGTGVFHKELMIAKGKNVVDAPKAGSTRELATAVFVNSESGVHGWVSDRSAKKRWGRIEVYEDIAHVRKWDEAERRGERILERLRDPRQQVTYQVVPDEGANPYKDYEIGDWLYSMEFGIPTKRRVRQISLTWEDDGACLISITLSDKLLATAVKNNQQLQSQTGKIAGTTSTRTFITDQQISDERAPTPPSPPTYKSRAGTVEISWDGKDVNGEEPVWDQSYIELHLGVEPDFDPSDQTFHSTMTGAGAAAINLLEYDTQFYAKFVAVDQGSDRSAPSDEIPIVMQKVHADDLAPGSVGPDALDPELPIATDGNPPATAPVPVIRSGQGEIYVFWDGIVNPDPVKYRVYCYETSGTPTAADILIPETLAAFATTRYLPDGTPFDYYVKDSEGVETNERKLYYFRVQAYEDLDGDGPLSAEISGYMDKTAGGDVAFRSIVGEHIIGETVISSRIAVPSLTGARAEISEGFQAYDSAEILNAHIRSDGGAHFLRGEVLLDSATILDRLSLSGSDNNLLSGSTLWLRGTTQDPKAQPTAVMDNYPTKTMDQDDLPEYKRGLFWDGTNWFYTVALGDENTAIHGSSINEMDANADHVTAYPIKNATGGEIDSIGGAVKLGTTWYVLAWDPGPDQWKVFWYNSLTALVDNDADGSWQYTNEPSSTSKPCLGVNAGASRLIIARCNTSGNVVIREYTPSTGAVISTVTGSNNVGNLALSGVHRTTWLFPAERYVVCPRSAGSGIQDNVLVYDTSGTYQSNHTWLIANSATVAGFGYDGTNFFHLSEAQSPSLGHLVTYTRNWWDTESASWTARYTWRDSDAAGTGIHESGPSPARTFTAKKCARLTLTAETIPGQGGTDDPNSVGFYVGRGTVTLATTWRQTDPANGVITKNYDEVAFSGDNLGSLDAAFPSAAVSKVRDDAGQDLLVSDGSTGTFKTGDMKWAGYSVTGGGATLFGGWMKGDGTAVARTTGDAARLFGVIGTTFGTGNGSTTYNLPDAQSRFLVGAGTYKALGGNEGLTEANRTTLHSHSIPNTPHTGNSTATGGGTTQRVTTVAGVLDGNHNHGGNTGNALGGGAFPNLGLHLLVKL